MELKTVRFFWFRNSKLPIILLFVFVFILLIYFLFSLPKPKPFDPTDPLSYPYMIKSKKVLDFKFVSATDIDDDGRSEILGFWQPGSGDFNAYPKTVNIFTYDMADIEQFNFRGFLAPPKAWFWDFDKDGEKEIIVSERVGDSVYLNIRTIHDDSLYCFLAATKDQFTKPDVNWGCSVFILGFKDINGDNQDDIISMVITPEAKSPRGLYVFDYMKGDTIWTYKMGAFPENFIIDDINGDGEDEIIFGTGSFGNVRIPINGTDDFHSHFIILNLKGEKIFFEQLSNSRGIRVQPFLSNLNEDDKKECLVLQNIWQSNMTNILSSDFFLFDFFEKKLNQIFTVEKSFMNIKLSDVDNDGSNEIVCLDRQGEISIYKYSTKKNFSLIGSLTIPDILFQPEPEMEFIGDLDNDGFKEIVIKTQEYMIIINHDLKIMAIDNNFNNTYGSKINIIQKGFGNRDFLTPGKDGSYLIELHNNYDYYLNKTGRLFYVLPVLFIIFAIFLLGLVIQHNVEKRHFDSRKGIIKLNRNHKITYINQQAKNLLRISNQTILKKSLNQSIGQLNSEKLKNLLNKIDSQDLFSIEDEMLLQEEQKNITLNIKVQNIRRSSGTSKGKIIFLSDQAGIQQTNLIYNWGAMAQQLAHEIKNPLSAILLNLKRIHQMIKKDMVDESVKYDKYIDTISEEIERLRNSTNAFMKFSDSSRMNLQLCDLNEIIDKIIKKYKIQDESLKKIIFKPTEDIIKIRVDQEMIDLALSNIVVNSLEALIDGGEVIINTRIIERIDKEVNSIKNFIQVEIMDNGQGIKKEDIDNIFEPGFTTKSGGAGFGLSITRHIISAHKGSIDLSSEEGSGTVVTIDLPLE